jgi:hypothetical protein
MARVMSFLGVVVGLSVLLVLPACGGQEDLLNAKPTVSSANCYEPPPPLEGPCWLTAGGTKFEPVIGGYVAEHGPKVNFGGNVYPSCSPEPGEGGQWNHVDHAAKLHFLGTAIDEVVCGNVLDHPAGSESPVTAVNFINFRGRGWIQGIAGNKLERTDVCFVARAEDRAEPGSRGQKNATWLDRYFIRVFDCGTGAEWLQLGTADVPMDVTTGNLQLHASSCP